MIYSISLSSLSFLGNATSYLRVPNTNDFDFGTGDFTIEWYQYQTDLNPFTRIFQVGTLLGSTVSIGVSIERSGQSGIFYYWRNNAFTPISTISRSNYINKWVHFAVSRSSGRTQIFMNGVSISSIVDTTNYNGTADLVIGNESSPANNTSFGGYITYFTWVKGIALYTSSFTVSNTYPTLTNDYILLLTADEFGGTLGSTVANNNVGTGVSHSDNRLQSTPITRILGSLFTNNAQVYYKPGSMASCGVGSVRNS